ncbi:putative glycoside hydrolase [Lachnospiraceae bacterium 62-35]
MKRWLLAGACLLALTGCAGQESAKDITMPAPIVIKETESQENRETERAAPTEEMPQKGEKTGRKVPVKVKGIYLTAPVAGSEKRMDEIIGKIDETEINAVVIDFKNDMGRVTCSVDSQLINEIDACQVEIKDMPGLIRRLKKHGIYTIARIVAFRDPYLAEKRPEWCLKLSDGTVFRDRQGLAWINPYKKEVWNYLTEIGEAAAENGFDEVQFDYIRFCTERGVGDVVFEEKDTMGRSKAEAVTQFTSYVYRQLSDRIFVSADVFGGIISSQVDAEAVGQNYGDMAAELDYICPMIYPSHYGDGYFGIAHPDTEPYQTIRAALKGSAVEMKKHGSKGNPAIVRPWLQDFTASYLDTYIEYGPEQVRAQIQALYDAGYDQWMLWSASCQYSWEGLKTPEEAEREAAQIKESRAALSRKGKEKGSDSQESSLAEFPELPEYVAPAGSSRIDGTESVEVVIPQMQMD